MVRVISVHHFASQHIQTVEGPTACTTAPPNRLLLALTSNCVEVRDLKNNSDVLFLFPTVDEAIQIIHCLNGDYVATLETKFNRQNRETNFVRVYINWDSIATLQQSKMTSSGVSLGSSECGMVQPMRARIAGRVTPTTNQSELGSLEMIEVPVKRNPNAIACCQVSGNLIILSNRIINIHTFQIKTHDISKLRFIDFEEMNILIELSFAPHEISICENYIACVNRDSLHLFKITQINSNNNKDNHTESSNVLETDFGSLIYPNNKTGPIDFKQMLREELLHPGKEKMTVNLPTIVRENSLIHKNSPFTFTDKEIVATVKPNSPVENKSMNYKIHNLIQLKLVPIIVESAQRQVAEEFKSLILKPLYIDQNLNKNCNLAKNDVDNIKFLKSDFCKCLNSVACMIATQQEGYLYFFSDSDTCLDKDNCIAIYPFTAPVYKIVMEDYFLHALTETGLESYTLRIGHQLCRNFEFVDSINVACPPLSDSICLVGLRPFLGVEQMLLADNYLVLLANAEGSPTHSVSSNSSSNATFFTLYNLELPTPKTVFNDISIVANVHRFTSAQTYCHLVSEAHMVLRKSLLLKRWSMTDENVRLIIQLKSNVEDVLETYRTSCALLGDHFIMCSNTDDYALAIPYYKMARIMPFEVLKRVKKIQEQSNNQTTKGLIHYLKHILLEIKTSVDADKYFGSSSKNNFAEAILELLESHGFDDLPNLILKSKILREYSTEKLIQILTEKISENFPKLAERHLALAILYVQKCNVAKAQEHIESITRDNLCDLLLENWDLLFETTFTQQYKTKGVTTFSELAILLISVCPGLLSDLLVTLMIDKKIVNLGKIIKVFLEYLPSSIGNDSNAASIVFQKTLESYFTQYFSKPENVDLTKIIYERGASEGMKLLVRFYLSQLQVLQIKEENARKEGHIESNNISNGLNDKDCLEDEVDDELEKDKDQEKLCYNQIYKTYFDEHCKIPKANYLFSDQRYKYLDKMPPFQLEITSKLYKVCVDNYQAKHVHLPNPEADIILKKLQALLCSQVVPKQVIAEVTGFLAVNDNLRGNDSLQSIILGTNDGILLLVDACPQCLLQFGKDRFNRTDDWKFLIATVQRRILKLSQNENLKRICFFYKKILKDVLTHVASSMTLDQLVLVFPQRFSTTNYTEEQNDEEPCLNESVLINPEDGSNDDIKLEYTDKVLDILNEIQNYEPYIIICKETMHANQISKLIKTTGQQLLCTLNL